MGDLILGIDIGTTGTKCTIYNYSGEIAASAYQDYPMIHPQLNWTEQDPNVWWSCVRSNLHKCFENDGINSGRISVIGLSCTNAVTLVDSCGNPLYIMRLGCTISARTSRYDGLRTKSAAAV